MSETDSVGGAQPHPAPTTLKHTGSDVPNCPVLPVHPEPVTVYRILKGSSPCVDDLRTTAEENRRVGEDPCLRNAISFWDDVERCRAILRSAPKLGSGIAMCTIHPNSGPIKQTRGQGHWSWWPWVDQPRNLTFTVV